MDVKPFLHQHYLLFDFYENKEGNCDKCNQKIDGSAYYCESCQFWLHDDCAKQQLPPQISHPLHSHHPLTLQFPQKRRNYFVCQGCFTLSAGHRYICRDCDFVIDVLCASNTKDDVLEKHGRRFDGMYKKTAYFIHQHDLISFEHRNVTSYHPICEWCDKFLSGMCYGCFHSDCEEEQLFVHESCLLSIPTRILKHPFHPIHPLYIQPMIKTSKAHCNACKMQILFYAYHCRKCEFWLHPFCAKPAHQPRLKHDFHEHSLSYFEIESDFAWNFKCNFCNNKSMEQTDYNFLRKDVCIGIYRCVQCDVNLRLGCVPVPWTTTHGYHRHALRLVNSFMEDDSEEYYCDICEEERNQTQPVYCCKDVASFYRPKTMQRMQCCKYVAHIQCTLNKADSKALMPKSMEQEETGSDNTESDQSQLEIEHFDHLHSLQFYEEIEKTQNLCCKACYFAITNQAYGCKSCKYYLHKTCAKLSHELLHPIHPQHTLKLIPNIEPFLCRQCRDFTIGYFYKCYQCDFTLDVKCAISATPTNESQRLKEIERESKLCFLSQDHELSFFNMMHQTGKIMDCSICWQRITGPTYRCDYCGYVLHESCVGFPREIQLPILQGSPLHPIVTEVYSICRACLCTLVKNRIRYRCCYQQSEDYLEFHIQCANSLRRAIEFESHEHPLFYFGIECDKIFAIKCQWFESPFECNKCKNHCNGVPFFRCLVCDINFHLKCVPIPLLIKSKCHVHEFNLKDHFVEDNSREYYCDVCEEEREPKDHVYYCEECQFIAHIECVLYQVEGIAIKAEASPDLELYFKRSARKGKKKKFLNKKMKSNSTSGIGSSTFFFR